MALSNHVDVEQLIQRAQKKSGRDLNGGRNPHLHSLAYSSRYVCHEVPKFKMPEKSMDPNAAYQMIHDQLRLDGDSSQNLATFVTSWMEPEASKLMNENIGKNFADKDEYPKTIELQDRCVNMLSRLWNANEKEKPCGTSTVGSSEAFMLGGLAMKFKWRNERKKLGLPVDKPNIIMGNNAQVALEKFALYFDIELRKVPVTEKSRYVMDPIEAVKMADENTIGIVCILGSTYTGHFEDAKTLCKELDKLQAEKGWDIPVHIDGASGAFVAPFIFQDVEWDFRLPRVKSINVSGHKYGLVYPGVGWVVWRDRAFLPEELIFHIDYLGAEQPTFTLNFSRNSSQVIGQYYNFCRLGKEGYTEVMGNCVKTAKFFTTCLQESEYFEIHSEVHKGIASVPVVSFSLKDKQKMGFDEHDLSHELRKYGWIVPAYNLPPNCEETVILRVVVRELHSVEFIEELFTDIIKSIETIGNEIKKRKGGNSTTFNSVC